MDRKKVKFRWLHSALTPPVSTQLRNGTSTPPVCKTPTHKASRTFTLSDSPGSEHLGALSLNTPKRKVEDLCESVPPSGKVKMRKLFRESSEVLKTSMETSTKTSPKQLEPPETQQGFTKTSQSFILKKNERTPEEGSRAICRMALIAALGKKSPNSSSTKMPQTFTKSKSLPFIPSCVEAEASSRGSVDGKHTETEDCSSFIRVFADTQTQDHRWITDGREPTFAKTTSQDGVFDPQVEDCDPSVSGLGLISDSFTIFSAHQEDLQIRTPQDASTSSPYSFLSSNEDTNAVQPAAEDYGMYLPPSQRTVSISFKHPNPPNMESLNPSRNKTQNVSPSIEASLVDPFALPLFSGAGVSGRSLNSAAPRRQSEGGSSLRHISDSSSFPSARRLSLGAEPLWTTYPHDNNQPGFIDTHCHLDMLYGKTGFRGTFSYFRYLNKSSFSPEFRGCITDFCNPKLMMEEGMWESLLAEDMVWGAFGCHPHFANSYSNVQELNILTAMKHPKAVAFGEIGLDYSHKNSISHSQQKKVFERQLRLAVAMQKPLVIHCRDADDDLLAIMRKCVPREHKIHRHCFTNSYSVIEPFLTEFPNLYVGFTALITYRRAEEARNAVCQIPLNRIVLETDAPYFVPRQVRKDVSPFSHPGMGIHTLHELSWLKRVDEATVLSVIRDNTTQLYGI